MRPSAGYAARTLLGPWTAVVTVGLEIANAVQRGRPWVGEGMWTVEWAGIILFVLGPVVAGVAAVDAARLSRPGNIHLVVAVPWSWRAYVRAAAWCALPVLIVHLVSIAIGLAQGAVTEPSTGWGALIFATAVQCLVVCWFAAVGSLLGRFLPPIAAGLVGALAGVVASYLLNNASGARPQFALLNVGAATVSRLGLTYHYRYLGAQVVLLLLTSVLFVAVGTRTARAVRMPTRVGAGMAAVAIALLAVGPAVLPASRLRPDPQRPTYCFAHDPRICLFTEHRRYRHAVTENVDRLVGAARAAGYGALVPRKIVESSRTYVGARPGIASLLLPLDERHPTLLAWIRQLVYPLQCPSLLAANHAPPPMEFFDRLQSVEYTWLRLADPHAGLRGLNQDANLRMLSPAQVAKLMKQFAACDLG
jgi:hypothetical protein